MTFLKEENLERQRARRTKQSYGCSGVPPLYSYSREAKTILAKRGEYTYVSINTIRKHLAEAEVPYDEAEALALRKT